MVAVAGPAKVLVTGANGYLAAWVVQKYLEAGYSVRGTVRNATKSAFLNSMFAKYGGRFELYVVDDITKDGAFDEAVEGVEVVAHVASPFHFGPSDPDEFIIPAVQGTLSILDSVSKNGSSVKRVVLTSSIVSIWEDWNDSKTRVFDESNWNDLAVESVKKQGMAAGPFVVYQASKTLAERAAWDYVAAYKGKLSWDLVAINPAYIFGPSLTPAPTIDDINTSQRQVYDTLIGKKSSAELQWWGSWCHVALTAEAHVRATYTGRAGGERIIIRSGHFFFQDIWGVVNAASELGVPNVARGEPDAIKDLPKLSLFKSTKAEDLLGLKQISELKDMVEESVKDFTARGYPGFTSAH
ncbi:D-lactaldehyde dehydrogenase [Multifurca ochricompacta]|uniref:D-lactaldehyde dehydrogenase n=1 Tax=Multifurca ochricompacta TaxID=376703 RepID=A0AAD4LSW9_9AGAM|nr:D-lactaldehyde dehydrogenase [Multifurca ochricompacta]